MSTATPSVAACDPALLPDDPALLKAMLAEVLALLHASRHEGAQLQARLDQLLRRLYGRRCERLDANQLLLFEPAAAAVTPPPPVESDDSGPAAKPRRQGHGRRPLPAHLPRDRRVYELSEAERVCGHCGQRRVVIGQETSEQLDYQPASLLVIEHVRLTYACPCCEKQRRAGYDALFATGRIVEVGCWAHARRKFYAARTTDPENALYALGVIRLLYQVAKEARQQACEQQLARLEFEALRLRLRQEKSVPLLEKFGACLEERAQALLPKSPLAEAVG